MIAHFAMLCRADLLCRICLLILQIESYLTGKILTAAKSPKIIAQMKLLKQKEEKITRRVFVIFFVYLFDPHYGPKSRISLIPVPRLYESAIFLKHINTALIDRNHAQRLLVVLKMNYATDSLTTRQHFVSAHELFHLWMLYKKPTGSK